jgi:hypothetical protein
MMITSKEKGEDIEMDFTDVSPGVLEYNIGDSCQGSAPRFS